MEKNLTCVQRNARQIDDEGVGDTQRYFIDDPDRTSFLWSKWRPSISRAIGELQIYPSPNQFVDIGMERVPVRAKANWMRGLEARVQLVLVFISFLD